MFVDSFYRTSYRLQDVFYPYTACRYSGLASFAAGTRDVAIAAFARHGRMR